MGELLAFYKKIMKNKILPFSVIIFFGIIFFIFYKGLEDSKIYIPDVNTKKEIPVFKTKDFFNVRYQVKPFMLWIWLSVILISFGGIVSFLQKRS